MGLGERRCKGAVCAGDSDHSPAVTLGHSYESDACVMFCSPSTKLQNGADHNHTPAFIPCLMNSSLLVGNFGDMCLLRGVCLTSIGSPFHSLIFHGKRLLMKTEYFTLWEICSSCLCFCPHRMFLSAPCKGTGNYRAIRLPPHNYRQIL